MSDQTPAGPEATNVNHPPPPSPIIPDATSGPRTSAQLLAISVTSMICILAVMAVNQRLTHQPVLATSLASSIFLLLWQPNNAVNALRPLLGGHLLAMLVGFLASLVLPLPYASAAVSVAVTVALLGALRLVHPPAISTSLAFSYRPHNVSALEVFPLTVLLLIALAVVYLLVRRVLSAQRFAHWFGYGS